MTSEVEDGAGDVGLELERKRNWFEANDYAGNIKKSVALNMLCTFTLFTFLHCMEKLHIQISSKQCFKILYWNIIYLIMLAGISCKCFKIKCNYKELFMYK